MTHRHHTQLAQQASAEGAAKPQRPPLLPWFAVAFVILVVINGIGILPKFVVGAGTQLSQWFLVASMALGALLWVAARVYRVGILMYGKRPTFPEIVRWINHAN